MKKLGKVLILVLSLAVVLSTLVIVAGADSGNVASVGSKEFASFDDALAAVIEDGGEIKLLADAKMSDSVAVKESITIDLAGRKLTTPDEAFSVSAGGNLTITGKGSIEAESILVKTVSGAGETPCVNIIGKDAGINIVASKGVLVDAETGNLNFKNLKITAGTVANTMAVFNNERGSNSVMSFVAVEVTANSCISASSSIVKLTGTSSVKLQYCTFASNRVVFAFEGYVGRDVAIEASNSYFSSRAKTDSANLYHEIGVIGTGASVSCKMIFNDSVIESSFRPIYLNTTSDALLTLNNSAIKNNGMTGGEIAGTCTIVVNSGSMITSVHVPDALELADAEQIGTYIILKPGARMNESVYRALYVNNKTDGVRYGKEAAGSDELVLSKIEGNNEFKVIYDPIGNNEAPFMVVEASDSASGTDLSSIIYASSCAGLPKDIIKQGNTQGAAYTFGSGLPNETFFSWNAGGILSGVKFGTNDAFRYEYNGQGKSTTLLFGPGYGLPHNEHQVFVAEADFSCDSAEGFVEGTFSFSARGESNGGNYSPSTTINISKNGTASIGAKSTAVKLGEWNHVTIVIYSDKGLTGNTCKGKAYYYVNGELLGSGNAYNITGNNGNTAYLWGLRYDVAPSSTNTGASIVFDNQTVLAYKNYKGSSADDPISYSLSGAKAVNKEKLSNNITMGGISFESIDEALKAGNAVGVYPSLKGDVENQLVTVDGTIMANGYMIGISDDSRVPLVTYDENGRIYSYIFREAFSGLGVNYEWFIGDSSDKEALKDDSNYIKTFVPMNEVPEYTGEALPTLTRHIGQGIFLTKHVGWSTSPDAENPDELYAVGFSDAINMKDSAVKLFPIFHNVEVTEYAIVILDADGNFKRGVNPLDGNVYGSDWTTRPGKAIKLEYGETLVLMDDNIDWIGSFNSPRTATGAEKVFNFDLNGHTMRIDTAINYSIKVPSYFQIKSGETINFYSSCPGAKVSVHGMADNNATKISGGTLFQINGSGTNNVNANTSNTTNNNTHLNLGTVTRFGKTYSGSNLTVMGDTLVELANGDATCSVNVDGITFIKTINVYGSVIENHYFNGSVNLTNSNIIFANGGTVINGINNSIKATAVIDGCYILAGSNGAVVTGNDYNYKSVLYTNCVTNGTINKSNATKIGNNCLIYSNLATTVEGVSTHPYNRDMTIGNTDLETITVQYVKDFTKTSNTNITYNYADFTFAINSSDALADLYLPYFASKYITEDKVYTVTFKDGSGNLLSSEECALGGLPTVPSAEIGNAYSGEVISSVFDGTFSPELPNGVEGDITLNPSFKTVPSVNGIKVNFALELDFVAKLWIPMAYEDYIVSVTSGLSSVEIEKAEGASYMVVSVPVLARNAGGNIDFAINLQENEYTATYSLSFGLADYAEEILKNAGSEYTAESRALAWYTVNYAAEAIRYFGGKADKTLEALLKTYSDAKGEEKDRGYTAIADTGLSAVFNTATVKLTESPVYVFAVKAGFEGTVTVTTATNSYVYTVEASQTDTKIELVGMKAYELAETVTVTAEGTIGSETVTVNEGSFNLSTYASYHSENQEVSKASANAMDLINALYDYVTEAAEYLDN